MDETDFSGQVILVTGAGRGLGAAYARHFARRGGHVVVHDAGVDASGEGGDPALAHSVVELIESEGGWAVPHTANLLHSDACESLVADVVNDHGRIDVLVHNAGVVIWEDPACPEDEAWDQTMGVNVDAGFRLLRAAVPAMREQGYGRVVLTTSGRATSVAGARPGLVAYCAAKMAVLGLMVGFRANVTDHDIHLNAISPVAATRMLVREAPHLRPDDVAPAVLYLASPAMAESGLVLEAAGGEFNVLHWSEGAIVDLGPRPSLEQFASAWPDLASTPPEAGDAMQQRDS